MQFDCEIKEPQNGVLKRHLFWSLIIKAAILNLCKRVTSCFKCQFSRKKQILLDNLSKNCQEKIKPVFRANFEEKKNIFS